MCMHTTVWVSAARGEKRVPVAAVDAGQPQVRRDLGEADGMAAAGGVAAHLGGGQLGVPQRDDAQRHEMPVGGTAPLLDHPVVVGVHAGLAELAVRGLGEGLPAEAGERGEAQRHVGVVVEHVLHASDRVVAARAHLVVGHRRHRHLVAAVADRGDVALVDVDEVFEHPAVRRPSIVDELLLVGAASDVAHRADLTTLDARSSILEPLGQPLLPHVGRFDDVVIDADDHREVARRHLVQLCRVAHPLPLPYLTGRQIVGAGSA